MSSGFNPPLYGVAYDFYISVVDQANTKLFKSSATIASGDFQVSIDGGSLANLGTLPSVTPAASKIIKVSLSASEMQGTNIVVRWSDAAGSEWCDGMINIQPMMGPICVGTVTTGASATSIPTSAFTPAGAATDQFKGRILIFDHNTSTSALRGQATDITASTNASTPTFTVSTLSTAPSSGDTFRVY